MTIKAIKEKYQDYKRDGNETNKFVTYDYGEEIGKVVILVNSHPHKDIGRHVMQVVRIADGKELLPDGSCRPCDSLDDAIDVAAEMLADRR